MTEAETAALNALREFRATFNEGDCVDEESGLTAEHLDTAIEAIRTAARVAPIRRVDLSTGGAELFDAP